ncbi:MAG: signal peptide peptidase SppA [Candidatus Kapabacteria bacterium]|nr:signal peptide peptidase SppA [Candidatus Kapabacteria bacterium]
MSYSEMSSYMQTSPGAFKFGMYGFSNPAITSYLHSGDFMFALTGDNNDMKKFNKYALLGGGPNHGLGMIHTTMAGHSINDYRLSVAFGDRNLSLGLGYGFTGGDKSFFRRTNVWQAGMLWRPVPQLSIAASHTRSTEINESDSVAEIAIRPIGSYPLAFFADYSMWNDQQLKDGTWGAGISWEILDGIRVNGKYIEKYIDEQWMPNSDGRFVVSADISLGRSGYGFRVDDEMGTNTVFYRSGAYDRTILDGPSIFSKKENFVKVDLSGGIKYQSHKWFDNSNTLLGLLLYFDKLAETPSVDGLLINMTNIAANHDMLWEIREKLKELKNKGMKIVVFVDRISLRNYHLASVADKIIIDSQGRVMLEGFILGRSYYKSMLEKIGVGYQEFRYFKYKSAVEGYVRDNMSDADREQRQAIVDDWYDITRADICDGRGMTHEEFDKIVNGNFIYNTKDALEKNLADTVGRWMNAKDVLKTVYAGARVISTLGIFQNQPIDDQWSQNKEYIAVVYAEGVCAMDAGIKARSLAKSLDAAYKNSNIKAIVLRVDSPGGDPMASDYLAAIVRKNKGKKPLIVSQGYLAASGGYWLSMDADKIVSSPLTITGSIGVIASFMYDKGLKDDLGVSTDFVKKGKYADLGNSFMLPLLPIGLPNRNFNDDEKKQMEVSIKASYKEFVTLVAEGRGMEYDSIHSIAQGRVWTGKAALKLGLVDELGGLSRSIEIAREEAGIDKDADLGIVQYPEVELFDFSALLKPFLGIEYQIVKESYNSLKFRYENNAVPMTILPIDLDISDRK